MQRISNALNGVAIARDILAVVVEWRKEAGIGFLRPQGRKYNVFVKRAQVLRDFGIPDLRFGDTILMDIGVCDGQEVACNMRVPNDEQMEQR